MTSIPELPDPEHTAAPPRYRVVLLLAIPMLAILSLLYVMPRGDTLQSDLPEEAQDSLGTGPGSEDTEEGGTPARVAPVSGTSLRGRIVTEEPAELRGGRVLLRESPPVEERSYMGLFLTLVEGGAENLEKNLEKVFVASPVLASTALATDGSFRFSNAPLGSFVIDLQHEWLRLEGHPLVSLTQGQHVDLGTLGAELAGRLLVKVVGPHGRPVSGASLELAHGVEGMDFDNEEFWSDLAGVVRLFMPWKGTTDAGGSHLFRGLPERRTWELSTTAEGHQRVIEDVRVTPGSRAFHVVRLREGAGLRIRVRSPEGRPVSKAKVKIEVDPGAGARDERERLPFRATTDGAGLAKLSDLPAGKAEVRVKHVDHISHKGEVLLFFGETKALDVKLERGLEISGRVVDAEGRPVADAWVSRLRDFAQKVMGFDVVSFIGEDLVGMAVEDEGVRSDEDGRFVLGGLEEEDEIHLMAGADGFLPSRLGPIEPGSSGHELLLRRSASVTGVVVDQESGEPIPDFEAMCTRVSWFVFDRPLGRVRVTGSHDGRFVLSGLPRGRMTLRVRAENHADSERTISISEQEFDAGEVGLVPPARVEGMTLDPSGRALAGVRVWVAKGGMGDSSLVRAISGRKAVTSDAEGRFKLEVPAKRLRLVAEKRGFEPTRSRSVRVKPGEVVKDLQIKLGRGGSLHGIVVDTSGRPLEGWNVEAVSGNSMSVRFARSDEKGEFELRGLVSGQYLVDAFPDTVTAPAWMRRSDEDSLAEIIKETTENMIRERVQIRSGERAEVRLVWQKRGASGRRALVDLEGTVRVGGAPMDQGIVELVELGGGARTRYAEIARGSFEIPALAPGSYHARIKPGLLDRYLGEPELVRVPAASRHVIELGYPGGRLAGRVVYGEDGRPAQGILVSIHGGYQRTNPLADASFGDEAGVTDADGRFAFEGLPAGRYEIYAREMNWAGVENAKGAGRLVDLAIREGERLEDLSIELSGGGRLEVIIQDQNGPRPGALVRLLSASGLPIDLFPRTLTDRGGTVVLRNVPEGRYRIGVDAGNAAPLVSEPVQVADAKEKRVELYLRPGVRMLLTVSAMASEVRQGERLVYSVWERGGALLRAGVLALPSGGGSSAPVDGKLRETLDLGYLEPGNVVLRIECASFGIIEKERRVPASRTGEWNLELR